MYIFIATPSISSVYMYIFLLSYALVFPLRYIVYMNVYIVYKLG